MEWKVENLKPAAISWAVTMLMLLIGTAYEYYTKGDLGLLSIIFFTSSLVYWAAYLVYHKKN